MRNGKAMSEYYIEKSKVLNLLINLRQQVSSTKNIAIDNINGLIRDTYIRINGIPVANVRENKQGHWELIRENDDGAGNNYYQCSVCRMGDVFHPKIKVPFCWHCGSSMTEE